jgi:hypothetical protein
MNRTNLKILTGLFVLAAVGLALWGAFYDYATGGPIGPDPLDPTDLGTGPNPFFICATISGVLAFLFSIITFITAPPKE